MFSHWNSPAFGQWTRRPDGVLSRRGGLNETGFYRYAASEVSAPSDIFFRLCVRCELLTDDFFHQTWLYLRARHPLLDVTFFYTEDPAEPLPLTLEYRYDDAKARAEASMRILPMYGGSWDAYRNALQNGPRTVSDDMLCTMTVHRSTKPAAGGLEAYEFIVNVSHVIADGMSMVTLQRDLIDCLSRRHPREQLGRRQAEALLPIGLEARLPHTRLVLRAANDSDRSMIDRRRFVRQRWRDAIQYTMHANRARRRPSPIAHWPFYQSVPVSRQSVLSFDVDETRAVVKACKARGCTVGHLLYAAGTAAFTNLSLDLATAPSDSPLREGVSPDLPPIEIVPGQSRFAVGTPMNSRKYLRSPHDQAGRGDASDLVMLLAFLDLAIPAIELRCLPDSPHRGRDIDRLWALTMQCRRTARRALQDANFLEQAYITQEIRLRRSYAPDSVAAAEASTAAASSSVKKALGTPGISFGSSSMGDLSRALLPPKPTGVDRGSGGGGYDEESTRRKVEVDGFNVGMRVRAGEMLMHSYTFAGRLCLSLMYDDNLGKNRVLAWLEETARLVRAAVASEHPHSTAPTRVVARL